MPERSTSNAWACGSFAIVPGDLFYVLEYLEGLDLHDLGLRFGRMPSARVLHYLRQLRR